MKKNLIYLTLMLVFVFAQTSFAQEAHKKDDCKGSGKMSVLNLTDDQQKQIDVLKTKQMKESLQLKNQIKEKEAKLTTLESEDKADMGKINKTIDEIGVLKTDMQKKHAAHKQEIRKILTEEQRVKFDVQHGRNGDKKGCDGSHGPKMEMGKHKMHDNK